MAQRLRPHGVNGAETPAREAALDNDGEASEVARIEQQLKQAEAEPSPGACARGWETLLQEWSGRAEYP